MVRHCPRFNSFIASSIRLDRTGSKSGPTILFLKCLNFIKLTTGVSQNGPGLPKFQSNCLWSQPAAGTKHLG